MENNHNLSRKTVHELKEIARTHGMTGHSRHTRKHNLTEHIRRTLRNRGTTLAALTVASVPAPRSVAAPKPPSVPVNLLVKPMTVKPVAPVMAHIPGIDEEDESQEEDDDESACEVDGRLVACKKNSKRERLLWQCFKGMEVTDADLRKSFACAPERVRTMVDRLTGQFTGLRATVVQIGGQSNNFDYTFQEKGRALNIELKTNKGSTKPAVLAKVPWTGYGQLLQIFVNVKDPKYAPLFGSFDVRGMERHWFDTRVIGEMVPRYGIVGDVTFESYCFLMYKSSSAAAKHLENPSIPAGTRALFKYFSEHRTKADNDYRASLWKTFSRAWMQTHRFDDGRVLELLTNTLNKKDMWVCTTKQDAYVVEGPKCLAARFKELKMGKDTTVSVYECRLVKPSTGEEYTVEIKFRFYWKNGGQGVHNLCLQIS
jgi:hypothetical protein